MFTPKNIQDALEELYDLCDPDYMVDIQSIPSPKAEPFKRWLAQVGRERIEETIDPEQAIDRALETYQKRDMIQTGFISGFFLSVSVMSLPLNGRSEAYSRAKNI